ncbi:alpha/beta fold hydrolase [Actinokineospora sp. 24-640]
MHTHVGSRHMWSRMAPILAREHRITAYDMRGFGDSPAPAMGFRHVDDLHHVLDSRSIRRAALVGAGLGAKVALDFANRQPDRVSALVLFSCYYDDLDISAALQEHSTALREHLEKGDIGAAAAEALGTWVKGTTRSWTPALRHVAAGLEWGNRRALENQLARERHTTRYDWAPVEGRLHHVAAPALVGIGQHDISDHRESASLLADVMPHAELRRYDNCGHHIVLEEPGTALSDVRRFLVSHLPRSQPADSRDAVP